MEPSEVRDRLRGHGLTVHHAVRRKGHDDQIVVFLEGALHQHDEAAVRAMCLPGVVDVTFSPDTPAIMYLRLR